MGSSPLRALVLGAVLAISLAACCCGSTGPDSSGLHVCIATSTDGANPHSFTKLASNGAQGAGAHVQVVVSHVPTDYLTSLQHCAAAHPNLVIAVSSDMAAAVWRAAQLHQAQRFALVDSMPVDDNGQPVDLPNVSDLLFNEQEPGYLVGALAGLIEKNKVGSVSHNVLGILGKNHGPGVDPYIAGYIAGARHEDPDVTINLQYSDSQDAAFCKQLGITQLSAGADILFEVTGRCASGYIDAAYDAGAYAIGSDNDMAYASPAVITSALKRVDQAVAITVRRLQNGQFSAGQQVFSLQEDATGFSTPSSVVPQALINQVIDLRTKIHDGEITPPDTIPPGI
jgi:basic membrane protein A and related proteins